MVPDFSRRDRFVRVSQRGMLPRVSQLRNLDIIKKTDTISASGTLASGEDTIFSMTTRSKKGIPVFIQEDISLFEGSIAEANLIPNGANIIMSDYQIVGPWREQDSGDGKNIVTKIYIRNTTASAGSDFSKLIEDDDDNGYFAGIWLVGAPLAGSWGFGRAFTGDENYGAARFTNITIPQGATINSASLTLLDSTTGSAVTVTVKIHGIDEDNTADFTVDPDSRAKTTAAVDWDFTAVSQVIDTVRESPDLATVIQEIVDRPGWSSGNALGLISDDDGTSNDNIMRWYSFGGSSTKCALLEINHSGSAGESKTVIFRGQTRYISPISDVTIE